MKRVKLSVLLCIMLLICSIALCSCAPTATGGGNGDEAGDVLNGGTADEGAEDSAPAEGAPEADLGGKEEGDTPDEDLGGDEGESGDADSGNGESGDTIINENVTNNDITINGTASNVAYAASKGLRSAVSIYCAFEKTVVTGSFWNQQETVQAYYTTGSGVIYELDGEGNAFIITNFHVVYDADSNSEKGISDSISVYLYGMESEANAIEASFVGGSAKYDIAVLRIDNSEVLTAAYKGGVCAPIECGDSNLLTPGMAAIAIGNPSSSSIGGISVTRGIVSVDSEYITMTASDNSGEVSFRVIRIDAAVNSGNSGGGLFDEGGELIGIVNAKVSSSTIEGIGYAIPVSVARAVADNIIDNCYLEESLRPLRVTVGIGVGVNTYRTEYDTEKGLLYKVEEVMVSSVSEGSIADGRLIVGDIVKSVKVGEREVDVTRTFMLIDAMIDVRAGDTITLTVVRDGAEITVEILATEDAFSEY